MGKLHNLKYIKILHTTQYFPCDSVNVNLISDQKLKREFKQVRKQVQLSPLPNYSYDRSYLLRVAALFGVKLTFKKYNGDDIRGVCWPQKKRIKICLHENYLYNKHTLTHEIGHILQVKLDFFKEKEIIFLSEEVRMEQQAEAIAYYLCKILWPSEKFNRNDFNCYFEEEDIIWLDEFYSEIKGVTYINDLFIFKK